MKIKWLDKPQKHDYPAAASYLSLVMDLPAAKNVAEKLKKTEMTEFAAKDIFQHPAYHCLGSAIAMWKKIAPRSPEIKAVSVVAVQGQSERPVDYRRRLSSALRGLQV